MPTEYRILFNNLIGCAIGISDVSWAVTVVAESEAEAIDRAVEQARVVNRQTGMPPHGVRLRGDDELRRLAVVWGGPVSGES